MNSVLKALSAFVLFLTGSAAQAQVHAGAKVAASLNHTDLSEPKTYRAGYQLGAFARYDLTSFLFLHAELNYSQMGGGYDSGYYYVRPEVFRQNVAVTFHTAAVPLFFSATLPSLAPSHLRPVIMAGAEYAYAFKVIESYDNVYRYRGDTFVSEGKSRNATDEFKLHQPSMLLGVGMALTAFGHETTIDIRYKSTFEKTEISNGLNERLSSLSLNVGVTLF